MKLFRKTVRWALILLLLLAVALTFLWLVNAPERFDEDSQSFVRLNRALYEFNSMELEFVDDSRVTPKLGDFSGDQVRTLRGRVWFPEIQRAGKMTAHPLLVFSHGFGSYHQGSRHIAQYLARHGYIVAAVDFPLSNVMSPAGSPQLLDIVNQPGDVSAVIDHMLTLSSNKKSRFFNRIDTQNIGVYGLSLGGLTTALVSFHPDYQDTRIKAAVMMAPPLESFSDSFYTNNLKVQSLLMSGTMDRVVPAQENAELVKPRHPKGWFLSLDKGSHLGFANVGNPIRWMDNPDNLGCAMMGRMLSKLELPDQWSKVLPNTGHVLRNVVVSPPCPDKPGKAMNGLHQQWLTRIAIGAFFDMHLRSGTAAKQATEFFTTSMLVENPDLTLVMPK